MQSIENNLDKVLAEFKDLPRKRRPTEEIPLEHITCYSTLQSENTSACDPIICYTSPDGEHDDNDELQKCHWCSKALNGRATTLPPPSLSEGSENCSCF